MDANLPHTTLPTLPPLIYAQLLAIIPALSTVAPAGLVAYSQYGSGEKARTLALSLFAPSAASSSAADNQMGGGAVAMLPPWDLLIAQLVFTSGTTLIGPPTLGAALPPPPMDASAQQVAPLEQQYEAVRQVYAWMVQSLEMKVGGRGVPVVPWAPASHYQQQPGSHPLPSTPYTAVMITQQPPVGSSAAAQQAENDRLRSQRNMLCCLALCLCCCD